MDWLIAISSTMIGGAVFIFLLRVMDVTLATVRIILTLRGLKLFSTLTAFIGSLVWVVAVSRVLSNMDNVFNIIGYSGGFAVGTLLGIAIEDKMALGFTKITIITPNKGSEILKVLRDSGYGATSMLARGQKGSVTHIEVIAGRKEAPRIQEIVEAIDPDCFMTFEEARQIHGGYLPQRSLMGRLRHTGSKEK